MHLYMANGEDNQIEFQTYRGTLSVAASQLKRHSKLFDCDIPPQKSPQKGASTNVGSYQFDLKEYDVTAVLLLLDYVKDNEVDIKTLSHFAFADLLQLAEILEVPTLRERVEKMLSVTVESSPDQIATALLSVGAHPKIWRSALGRAVCDVASRNYQDLTKATIFHKIPPRILIEILDSCDLMTTSEQDVFEVARKWLKFNHNRVLFAPNLLECVRFYRLNDQQRAYIIQSIRKLPQGAQLEMIAKTVVGNLNGFRACVLKTHWQNPRCGALPKDIRDRPLNVIPDFIDLAQLRKVPLMPTGIKRQLSGANDGKENSMVVIRNVHKPRSMRQQRRRARHQRNKEDLKVIESILGPKTIDVGTDESRLVEKILGPGKLKKLQTSTACSSPVESDNGGVTSKASTRGKAAANSNKQKKPKRKKSSATTSSSSTDTKSPASPSTPESGSSPTPTGNTIASAVAAVMASSSPRKSPNP